MTDLTDGTDETRCGGSALNAGLGVLKPINTAPKDEEIIGVYEDGGEVEMFWSDRPVCMLGNINGGFPAGWATCGKDVDYNLPIDEPMFWKDTNPNI